NALLENQPAFPRCVRAAGAGGGEKGAAAGLGQISRPAESTGGGVVTGGVREVLRVDRPARGADVDPARVRNIQIPAELQRAAVENNVGRREAARRGPERSVGADLQHASGD